MHQSSNNRLVHITKLSRSHTPEHPNDQEPTSANKPDSAEHSNTVQHNTHVNSSALLLSLISVLVRAVANIDAVHAASVKDDSSQRQIAEHPRQDDSGAETLVIVLVFFLRQDDTLGSFPLGGEDAELGFVLRVEIGVVRWDCDVDFAAGFEVCCRELFGLVVTFCSPCDVVGVAEGVDVEDVDVGGSQEEVLDEAGCHMPGIEEEDRGEEVEEPSRAHADNEREEELIREKHGEGEASLIDLFHDRLDSDEDGGKEEVAVE